MPGFSDTSPKQKAEKKSNKNNKKSFYSSGSDGDEDKDEAESDESNEESDSDDEEESSESEDESEEESGNDKESSSEEESSEESGSEGSGEESDDESESSSERSESGDETPKIKVPKNSKSVPVVNLPNDTKPVAPSNLDLLLGLDEMPPSLDTPMLTPSMGGFLSPQPDACSDVTAVSAAVTPGFSCEVLNRMSTGGLSVKATFTRSPHLYCPNMAAVQLSFSNHTEDTLHSIGMETTSSGAFHPFPGISKLTVGKTVDATLGIDYQDSSQPANFQLTVDGQKYVVTITPRIGELVRPIRLDEAAFSKCQV